MSLQPETPEEMEWQYVQGESWPRPELARLREERAAIEQHVGTFLLAWASMDFTLAMTISTLSNPTNPGRLQRGLLAQSTSSKIEFFKAVLPVEWPHGQTLVRKLVEGNVYRNLLAHGRLGQSGYFDGRAVGWHLTKGQFGQSLTELDPDALDRYSREAHLLESAVHLLMGEPFTVVDGPPFVDKSVPTQWSRVDLASLIIKHPGTWASRADRDAFRELALTTFPHPLL